MKVERSFWGEIRVKLIWKWMNGGQKSAEDDDDGGGAPSGLSCENEKS